MRLNSDICWKIMVHQRQQIDELITLVEELAPKAGVSSRGLIAMTRDASKNAKKVNYEEEMMFIYNNMKEEN